MFYHVLVVLKYRLKKYTRLCPVATTRLHRLRYNVFVVVDMDITGSPG